jgi:hypothetical protein
MFRMFSQMMQPATCFTFPGTGAHKGSKMNFKLLNDVISHLNSENWRRSYLESSRTAGAVARCNFESLEHAIICPDAVHHRK